MKEKLIPRAYRIKREQDVAIKKIARKFKMGESEVVREGIDYQVSRLLTNS